MGTNAVSKLPPRSRILGRWSSPEQRRGGTDHPHGSPRDEARPKGAMKAVVLSAGQGKRLLPLTEENPKCLLEVSGGMPVLGFQLGALARAGIERAVLVVGFGAARVEAWLASNPVPGIACETLF